MAVLAAWNLLTALFLFLLIRRRSGQVLGLAAAALFLVLGRGWENLIWADQIGFVGSSGAGPARDPAAHRAIGFEVAGLGRGRRR